MFRQLSIRRRLTLAIALTFIMLSLFLGFFIVYSMQAYQREVSQTMNKGLASYIVNNYTLLEGDNTDAGHAQELFRHLMIVGPSFEFYLLSPKGKIMAYSSEPGKVQRELVDTQSINDYLGASDTLVYGDDPKNIDGKKIFTAAPIYRNNNLKGYLYIILGGQHFDEVNQGLLSSAIMRSAGWTLLAVLITGLIVMLWLTNIITKPLCLLTEKVKRIQSNGFSATNSHQVIKELNLDNHQTTNEIDILGLAFKETLVKLEQQYQRVVSVEELRKQMLSYVSHDLRTPLASLLGYLETWELHHERLSKEESKQYIETARKNAQQISLLIEQLFELAYLDGENVSIRVETFSIAELVQDVLQVFSLEAQEKNITLHIEPRDASIKARGDIEKLDRVFNNLIGNALRHTPEGGDITVKLQNKKSLVTVEVIDNGIGIPGKDLPHIFEPHYKAGNSVRGNSAHGGLGLAITKRLLELHQSAIKVTSSIDRGTRFEFDLKSL